MRLGPALAPHGLPVVAAFSRVLCYGQSFCFFIPDYRARIKTRGCQYPSHREEQEGVHREDGEVEDREGRRAANGELSAWLLRGKGSQQACGSAVCYQRCHSPSHRSWYMGCVSIFLWLCLLVLFPFRASNNFFLCVSRTHTKILMPCYKRLLEQNGPNSNSI